MWSYPEEASAMARTIRAGDLLVGEDTGIEGEALLDPGAAFGGVEFR